MPSEIIEFGFTAVLGYGVDGKDRAETQEKCQRFVDQWIASAEHVHVEGVHLLCFGQPDGEEAVELFKGLMRQSKQEAN